MVLDAEGGLVAPADLVLGDGLDVDGVGVDRVDQARGAQGAAGVAALGLLALLAHQLGLASEAAAAGATAEQQRFLGVVEVVDARDTQVCEQDVLRPGVFRVTHGGSSRIDGRCD